MPEDFPIRSALAGIGPALVAGPPGSFAAGRPAASFRVPAAHPTMLGVAWTRYTSGRTLAPSGKGSA